MTEVLLLVFVGLLLFGPYNLVDVTQSIGKSIKKFKDAKNEIEIQAQSRGQEASEVVDISKNSRKNI